MRNLQILGVAVALGVASLGASAAALMPDYANVPTDWTTDRYAPASFANVGTYQGRNDVLGIGISSADAFNNRPAGYQSTFYNTQGKQHVIAGGPGSSITADLFIQSDWRDGANGSVRSDMWGVMADAGSVVSAYPIIGFTNYGGSARYRVWDDDTGWHDLAVAVTYDAWTEFEIQYSGSSFDFLINGVSVYSDGTINGTTGFSAVIMQAYNFGGDPSINGAVANDYTAHWANASTAQVPEPASLALTALALLAAAAASRRRA